MSRYLLTLSCVFAFVSLMSPSFASLIGTHDVLISVDNEDVAHVNVSLEFIELDSDRVSYLVFSPISNLAAWDSYGPLLCGTDKQTYGTLISCRPNSNVTDNYTAYMYFESADLVRTRQDAFMFSYNYGIKTPTGVYSLRLLLPEGAALISSDEVDPYYPADAVIGTEKGRRLSLDWVFDGPELGRSYSFDVYYEFVGTSIIPDDGTDYAMILAYVFGIGFVVFLSYTLILKRKGKETGVKRVFSVLKDDERKVIDIILSKDGKCRQRDIVKATDFSKAKVSRIMTELEARGIIKRSRMGRTNRVFLNENVDIKKQESS